MGYIYVDLTSSRVLMGLVLWPILFYCVHFFADLYKECGFYQRLIKIDADFPGANVILHKLGVLPEALCNIWSNERALNLAEQILGSADIAGNPVWNLRTKTPNNEATTVPWHQGLLNNINMKLLYIYFLIL